MNSPAGLTLPRTLRNIIRGGRGGDCKVGKVTLYVLRIGTAVCWVSGADRDKLTYFLWWVVGTSGLSSCGCCSQYSMRN